MKKSLLGTAALVLFVAIGAHASDPPFLFGAWTNESPLDVNTDSMQFCRMLHDTLHFNTILGQCYTPTYLSLYATNGLHVISKNDAMHTHFLSPEDVDTLTYWPHVYGESAYGLWESEGSHLGPCDLIYRGGQTVTIDGVSARYFAATTGRVDSVIQTGPSEACSDSLGYGQIPWYTCHLAGGDQTYHYEVRWRFKLGPDPDTLHNSDTIAVCYVERTGIPYQSDTLLKDNEEVVYILDSLRTTDFDWSSPVKYNLSKIQSCNAYQCRYVYGMNFKVRWYGKRDIYIDQVKIMNTQGKQLWESPDTLVGFQNLRDFSARWFGDSPTILGWFVMEDQYMRCNRDNVYSMRRVDSLLTTWAPYKKAFVVPGNVPDYLSIASYSNLSYQVYPIYQNVSTNSDYAPEGMRTLQAGWNDECVQRLGVFAQMARDKGIKHYATVQGFEDRDWRRTTTQENLCMVNLCLAYGISGILYWHYYGVGDSDVNDGFVDGFAETGNRTDTWYQVRDVIGPYIDKMGPIFASLEWKGAWKSGDTPPSGSETQAVYCNEYGQLDQLPLYLQVAEFSPTNPLDHGRYFFLVNRRCLPTEQVTGHLVFSQFSYGKTDPSIYYITDMLTGVTTVNGVSKPGGEYPPPFGPFFDFSISAGAGRLYRVSRLPCRRGDPNNDGSIDISDAVLLISRIFSGGPAPLFPEAGDANSDGTIDISDAVFLISYIFSGGPVPAPGCD